MIRHNTIRNINAILEESKEVLRESNKVSYKTTLLELGIDVI